MGKSIPAVLDEPEGSLYRKEPKVYPREVDGRFQRLRHVTVWVLLGIYYLFPWLRWDGRQAVLFDLPARRFYVFGLNFWPQDFFLLAMLLMIAGLALFFFTALAGRLWCGYACPQTVWTEVFLWIERLFEGDRPKRMKLDKAPWTRDKILRKAGKHAAWIVFALWTGFTFVGFFTPIRELADRLYPFDWGGWETFWVLFYGFATWGNAGFLREQVCKYMCPYARFQGAMFDRNTLIISYDVARGEPRGPRRRGAVESVLERARPGAVTSQAATISTNHGSFAAQTTPPPKEIAPLSQGGHLQPQAADGGCGSKLSGASAPQQSPSAIALGDCIDCTICVQVCPTGIDIRQGLQFECIACGACIDACDQVMDRMAYPHGLIRYTTQNAMDGHGIHVLRPRVLVYATALLLLMAAFAWGVATRNPLIVDVLRDRHALYRTAAGGDIENSYLVKLINKDQAPHRYRIELTGAGPIGFAGEAPVVEAGPEQVVEVPVTLSAPAGAVRGRREIAFEVRALDGSGIEYSQQSSFFAPTESR